MHDDTDSLARWLTHYATCFVEDEKSARKMLEIVAALRAPAQCAGEPVAPENAIEWIARSAAPLHAALKKYPDAFEALHFLFNEMNHPSVNTQCAGEPVNTQCVGEPVAWRWQVYGIWHYTGGYPVSGAEPLYLRDASNAR